MTRVTRSKVTQIVHETKENENNNKIVADPLKTPRKRSNKIADDGESSPPKIQKDAAENSPGISNKFRTSLSIEEDARKGSYSRARVALTLNENFELPGREKEIEQLKDFIDTAVEEKKSCSLYISGLPGSGKISPWAFIRTASYFISANFRYVR